MRLDKQIANREIKISVVKGSDKKVPLTIQLLDGTLLRFDEYKGVGEIPQGQTEAPLTVEFYPWKESPNYSETRLEIDETDPRRATMLISGPDAERIRVFRAFFRCRGVHRITGMTEVLFFGSMDIIG